jgi:hypothetical protein
MRQEYFGLYLMRWVQKKNAQKTVKIACKVIEIRTRYLLKSGALPPRYPARWSRNTYEVVHIRYLKLQWCWVMLREHSAMFSAPSVQGDDVITSVLFTQKCWHISVEPIIHKRWYSLKTISLTAKNTKRKSKPSTADPNIKSRWKFNGKSLIRGSIF